MSNLPIDTLSLYCNILYPFLLLADISRTKLSLLNDKLPIIWSVSLSLKCNVSEDNTVDDTNIDLKRLVAEPKS